MSSAQETDCLFGVQNRLPTKNDWTTQHRWSDRVRMARKDAAPMDDAAKRRIDMATRAQAAPSPLEGMLKPIDHNRDNAAAYVTVIMAVLLKWKEQIDEALHHAKGQYVFDDVVAKVAARQIHVYEYDEAVVLMQYCVFPQYSTYHCFIAAGDMQTIKDAEEYIAQQARSMGCKHMTISGRTGWARELKPRGWEHVMSTMYKEL